MITTLSTTISNGSINCLNARDTHVDIFNPIPSFGTTIIGVYFLPIIVIFGVAGNAISMVILHQAAKRISSHYYLWWLGIFDIISLISYMPTFWAVMILRPYYHYVYGPQYAGTWVEYSLMGRYVCQTRMFITFTARTCSIYTIVLVTLERFVMVVFPMHKERVCTVTVAKISIGVMAGISICVNFPWFFAFNVLPKACYPLGICVGNTILLINKLVEFILLCLVPCVVIVVCNCAIIHTIRGRIRMNLLVDTHNAKRQERDITIRLLVVSFAFFILTIPSLVVVSIQTVQQLQGSAAFLRGAEADAFALSIILFAINLAVNFIIYCLTGNNFRTAAIALVRCDWKEMKIYRAYLLTDTTKANDTANANGDDGRDTDCNEPQQLRSNASSTYHDSFHQKRALIQTRL